jgi:hypothetical protein
LLNLRPTHPPSELFFPWLFFGAFLGVSRQGEFKNTIKIFLQKVHVENFPQNFDKNFDVSFSSTFFVLSRFRVFISDGSSKALQKNVLQKDRVEKFLQKSRPKLQNRFFLGFVYHVFGRFSVRGVQKHDSLVLFWKINKSDPGPFLASDPPTHHGSPRFVLGRPLDSGAVFGARLGPGPGQLPKWRGVSAAVRPVRAQCRSAYIYQGVSRGA